MPLGKGLFGRGMGLGSRPAATMAEPFGSAAAACWSRMPGSPRTTLGAGGIDVRADAILIRRGLMTASALGSGKAGQVTINAGTLELHSGGQIFSGTFGPGDAGRVTINADRLVVRASPGQQPSAIASTAEEGSTGRAGTMVITAREIAFRHDLLRPSSLA
jgi:large exoprotein involved in heme utilization and adhesion